MKILQSPKHGAKTAKGAFVGLKFNPTFLKQ